jgi:ABC-type nickel/cobalt efflux system permease component RcnA
MTRKLLAAAAAVLALALAPSAASAHPLGNFSVNHLTQVSVSADRVDVRYILDEAEIPTFQQRNVADAELLRRKRAEVARRLQVIVDGRVVALRPADDGKLTHPAGQGGLVTTRVELPLVAVVKAPRRVEVRDETFPGRVGWKAVVARPGEGTAVRSSAPASDPTNGLRTYPEDLLKSPADLRTATLSVTPGAGTVTAPDGTEFGAADDGGAEHGITEVFSDAAAGQGVLIVLLLSAFAWGALHALSPGHGKAMVAAYLVGTRGTAKHAVALGGIVTFTHTIGVFALGAVALALSEYILPEDLYPWLNLVSGALVLVVGASVLRSRIRWTRARREAAHVHSHDHDHHHHHDHDHDHDHAHDHHHHTHTHDHAHDHGLVHSHGGGKPHSHALPDEFSWRGLVAMGASAGLIPCPSALVVLLGAVAQGQIALGMLLIVAFSAGLAATLTLLGIAVVYAARSLGRLPIPGRLTLALPTVSAVLIIAVGIVLTAQALPQVA